MNINGIFNPWFVFSSIFLLIWIVIFIFVKGSRKEMFLASILTAPFGLTEPLFVPEYWSPPSLFNLALKTGFDIESLIWCFAVGGIAAVLFESVFKVKHLKISKEEMHKRKHKLHLFTLILPIPIFLVLYFATSINTIYIASISMFIGAIGAFYCRPDLKKKIFFGGLLFLVLYFMAFFLFILVYPEIVESVWNLNAISEILIFKVPLEELVFAIIFGMLWSGYYEHIKWYKLSRHD